MGAKAMVSDCEGFQRFFFCRLTSWSSHLGTGSKEVGWDQKENDGPREHSWDSISGGKHWTLETRSQELIPINRPQISPPPFSPTLHKMNRGRVQRPPRSFISTFARLLSYSSFSGRTPLKKKKVSSEFGHEAFWPSSAFREPRTQYTHTQPTKWGGRGGGGGALAWRSESHWRPGRI